MRRVELTRRLLCQQAHGSSVSVATPNGKCLSAQWGGSYDHAGVLYACAVNGHHGTGTLNLAKQYVHPPPSLATTRDFSP